MARALRLSLVRQVRGRVGGGGENTPPRSPPADADHRHQSGQGNALTLPSVTSGTQAVISKIPLNQAPLAQPRRCTIAPTAEGSRSGPIRVFHTRRNTAPSVGPLAGAGFSHRSGGNSDALGLLRRRHCDCGSSITWYFVAVLLGSGTTDCKTLSARYRNILHNRHLRQSKGNQGLRRPGPGGCKILPRRALIANQSGCRIRCSRVELAA
jgi:hypothetical protein